MSRSTKKGPYVQPVLLKRVNRNERSRRKEKFSRLGQEVQQFSLNSLVTHLPFMTAENMFLYM